MIFTYDAVPGYADMSDWRWLQNSKEYRWVYKMQKGIAHFDRILRTNIRDRFTDYCWYHYLRKLNVRTAIEFIDRYEHIYTTRMHAAILSVILGKDDVVLFDNSYGKSSSFYQTWLEDVEGIQCIC